MVDDREQRMEALRTRVKAKKEAAISGGILEEELVVSASELTTGRANGHRLSPTTNP